METPTQQGGVDVPLDGEATANALLQRYNKHSEPPPEKDEIEEVEPIESEEAEETIEATEDDGMQGEEDETDEIEANEEQSETFKSVSELAEATGQTEEEFLSQIKLTTKVNGEETEVSLADLKKGYQLESAYTRNNKEFLDQKRQFEEHQAKAQEELKREFERTGHAFRLAQDQLTHEFNAINWQELERDDPSAYMLKRQKFGERQAQIDHAINQATQQAQGFVEKQTQAQAEQAEKYLKQQDELLLSQLPEWKDTKVRKEQSAKVAEYLVNSGFNADEVANIKDHRIILLAQKAMGGDSMKTDIDIAKKKVNKAPKLVKPNARQSKSQAASKTVERLKQKAFATGLDSDIAAALLSRRQR